MTTFDSGGTSHDQPTSKPLPRSFLSRFLFSTDHKIIGLQYLWLALLCVFLGMGLSLLMRLHLLWPNSLWPNSGLAFLGIFSGAPDRYAALTLLHGSLMIFFVFTAAPQAGFGSYFLPLQIGATSTAFPNLNLAGIWLTIVSLAGMTGAFFLVPATGIKLWIASVALFCVASLLVALNLSVTTIDLRVSGMTLPRLPITVWAWFITAVLSALIFSILLASCVLLLADGWLGTRFFRAPFGPTPLLAWQRLFWFFAQAEVYVALLPCFGIVTHLLAMFARRPVWKERAVVLALCAVGLFGFCIWGQHMFATGMSPSSPMFFGLLASSLGVPSSILLLSWFGTLWNTRIRLNTAMLFVLGFISLFLSGGFSGLFLLRGDLPVAAVGDEFVTGHFHLVMGVAATFAILAALFYWFPKMFGRRLNEALGKTHFWLTFAGVYCVFMPMHWAGLAERASWLVGSAGRIPIAELRTFITVAALVTVAAQALFFFNLINSLWSFWPLWRGERVRASNPWQSTTLEWMPAALTLQNALRPGEAMVYRGAYDFAPGNVNDFTAQDFMAQFVAPAPVAPQHLIERTQGKAGQHAGHHPG
jgi:cytochrome c oxidase subunit I